jgi:methyl-galactoside transport system substrate-binding protein
MQYIMLRGPVNDPSTPLRSKYSIQSLNDAVIQTQELASTVCYWDKECAKTNMAALFLNFDGKIEAIILLAEQIIHLMKLGKQ